MLSNIILGIVIFTLVTIVTLVILIKLRWKIGEFIADTVCDFFDHPFSSILKILIAIVVIIALIAIFALLIVAFFM